MLYQCDVFMQGAHLPLLLCGNCKRRLERDGATLKCVAVPNSVSYCSQCDPKAASRLSYYERRRRIV